MTETAFADKSYANFIKRAQNLGFEVTLLFFWLNSFELAKERVKNRVLNGGHHIESDVIERRYKNGILNLKNLYLPICDYWMIFDNSEIPSKIIAEGVKNLEFEIYDNEKFNTLDNYDIR